MAGDWGIYKAICFQLLRLPDIPKNVRVFWKLLSQHFVNQHKPARTVALKNRVIFSPTTIRNYVDEVKAIEGMIKKGQIRSVEVEAVVDTGAMYVCLSREDIEKLGLKYHDISDIKTVNGKAGRRIFKGA